MLPCPMLPELLAAIAVVAAKYDVEIPVVAHAGDGNTHPIIVFDATDPAPGSGPGPPSTTSCTQPSRSAARSPASTGSAAPRRRPPGPAGTRRHGADPPGQGRPGPGRDPEPGRHPLTCPHDPRSSTLRTRPLQPLPGGDRRARAAAARPPRPGLPRADGRDVRHAPHVWRTDSAGTLPVSATGSAAWTRWSSTSSSPGTAWFRGGQRAVRSAHVRRAARYGAEVVRVEHGLGRGSIPVGARARGGDRRARRRCRGPRPRPPPAPAAARRPGGPPASATRCCCVDCVTSVGDIRSALDEAGVDAASPARRSASTCPPGLAPFTFSARAFGRGVDKPRGWYFDLGLLGRVRGEAPAPAAAPTTTRRRSTWSARLHGGLAIGCSRRGSRRSGARHGERRRQAAPGRSRGDGSGAVGSRGTASRSSPPSRSPDGGRLGRRTPFLLLERHDLEIGAGAGAFASSVWRIGLMGYDARPDAALLVLAALRDALAHA